MDLKAEGLWDELLDEFQPEIVIEDWWVMSILFNCVTWLISLCLLESHT